MRQGYYRIEVTFDHNGERKRFEIKNCDLKMIKNFRETIFSAGFMYTAPECMDSADPDHYIVVNPLNVRSVDIWKQEKKF